MSTIQRTTPDIGEVFCVRGGQALVYRGETVDVCCADTLAVQKTVPMTEAMRTQLSSQYLRYIGSKRIMGSLA